MAVARGQKSTLASVASGTTLTTAWATNPQAGSTVLVFVQYAGTPTSVVDNGTTPTTFTADVSTLAGEGFFIYRANNIKLPASGSYSVTVTAGVAHTISLGGIEYSGVAAGPPKATNTGGATGTAVTTNAVSLTGAGVMFGGFSDASTVTTETITFNNPGAPFTEQFRIVTGSFWYLACADAITSGSGTATWTLGDSTAWGSAIAAYEPALLTPVVPRRKLQAVNRSASF